MRIRSIKPEFWRSADISRLEPLDRLLFIGLWSYVDDNGVGIDKLSAITADLFADDLERDSSETFARVSRGLQNLSDAGRITRYTRDGRALLHITNWSKHQRVDKPNKERYLPPTREDSESPDTIEEPSGDSREDLAPGTEEQGNRGTVSSASKSRRKPKARKVPLPPNWQPSRQSVQKLYEEHPGYDTKAETLRFVDYWTNNLEERIEWESVWRNWMRKEARSGYGRGGLRAVGGIEEVPWHQR